MGGVSPLVKVGFVSVHVTSLPAARPFYEEVLGLRVLAQYGDEEIIYDLAGTPLSVHVDKTGECGRAPGGASGVYVHVPDIQQARAGLQVAGVKPRFDEGNVVEIADDDGNTFVLWEPKDKWPPA